MRKLFWVIAIAIVVAIIAMARHQYYSREKYEAARAEDCVALAISPEEEHACAKDAQGRREYAPWWYMLVAWPEGIGGLALIATLGAIVYQGYWTRRAADATAESANAAYEGVTFAEAQWKLMIEEKRARLDLSVEPTKLAVEVAGEDLLHLIAIVSVRNIGESKAFIGRTSGTLITSPRNEPLGDVEYSPLDLPEKFIEADKTHVPVNVYCFPTATTATFAECLEAGTFTLHFFGFIEYETLGFWWRKEFGFDWKIVGRGLSSLFGLPDPYPNSPMPARDRITHGYWKANEEKDKTEYAISQPQEKQEAN